MSRSVNFLSLDLGPESGRGIVGSLNGQKLTLEVVHRFPNRPTRLLGSLHWDALRLFDEILHSLALASKRGGLAGVAIDAWGSDFGLLGKKDILLGNPYDYRDSQPDAILHDDFGIELEERIFQQTGVRLTPNSTLYQLLSMVLDRSPLLDAAECMLTIPNLLSFWLSGEKMVEFTNATTTQCYDPFSKRWAWDLIDDFHIPAKIFPEIIPTARVLGVILPSVAKETRSRSIPIISTASHNAASAAVAVPAECTNCACIMCDTKSTVGVDIQSPIIDDAVRWADFSNEGGIGGKFRLTKRVMGLWLIEESKRAWAREGSDITYDNLMEQAAFAPSFSAVINPEHSSFTLPGNMPERIAEYCIATNQPTLQSRGEVIRTALEGIAMGYRHTLEEIERLTNRRIETVHIVGVGSLNKLLCRLTANATGRAVIAGPVEATAVGNILVQAMTVGMIDSIESARELVRNSFYLQHYEPQDTAAWDAPYEKFLNLPN